MMALEKSLQINTLREFELLGEEPPSPLLLERLRACCLVVEALGYQVSMPAGQGRPRGRGGREGWASRPGGMGCCCGLARASPARARRLPPPFDCCYPCTSRTLSTSSAGPRRAD